MMGNLSDDEGLLVRRRRKSPSPQRWQSARSSPPPPEAEEQLLRARRGVVASPVRAGSTPAAGLRPATGRTAESRDVGTATAAKATQSARAPLRQQLPWSAGPGLASATTAGGTGGSSSGSTDRTRPWLQRRSRSVDAATLRRGGSSARGAAAGGTKATATPAAVGEGADDRRRASSVSPTKVREPKQSLCQ